jgi:hypothetical protein
VPASERPPTLTSRSPSFGHAAELDRCVVPTAFDDPSPLFPPETVGRLRAMAEAMFPGERDLCARVFAAGGQQRSLGRDIFADLAHCAMLHLLNFTEAVVLTKRAAEKLFKVLDMYDVRGRP